MMIIKDDNLYVKTTGQTMFRLASRKERKRKQKHLKELNVLVNDQYFADLAYGTSKNYTTFITFVPPGIIEDNFETAIFVMEPDSERPHGLVHFFHEIYFLDKDMSIQLDKDLVTQWSGTKVVNIRSDYTCSFYLGSTA